MRGVYRGDQLQNYYNVGRKFRKLWRRIFFYCIEVTISNSFCQEKMVKPVDIYNEGERKETCFHLGLSLQRNLLDHLVPGRE